MKIGKTKPLFTVSLIAGALMLFFTFFNLGFFVNMRIFGGEGLIARFEVPIGTKSGTLSTIADVFYTLAPFTLLASLFTSLFLTGKWGRILSASLATLPLTLYALLKIVGILDGEDLHFSVIVTLVFLIIIGGVTLSGANIPDVTRLGAYIAALHVLTEIALLAFSFLMHQKYSQFYFYETLPFGKTSTFNTWYVVFSIFLYYLFYSISLTSRGFALTASGKTTEEESSVMEILVAEAEKEAEEKEKAEKEAEEKLSEEDENENNISLSLEDLGIER